MDYQLIHSEMIVKRRHDFLICLCLAAVVIFAYSQIWQNGFVDFDDNVYVTENPQVLSGLSLDNVAWAFSTLTAEFWHPLTWLSFMLDTQLFGVNPRGYLFTNVLLHLLSTLLLYAFFSWKTKAHWQSAFVAALFAIHPLHVEAVAWIAQRKDVLSTLFWMLTMLGYARYVANPGFIRYLVVVIFFCLGLMTKPMLVTLPCVLLLLDYWPLRRLESSSSLRPVYALIREKVPLLILSGAASLVTIIAQQKAAGFEASQTASIAFRIGNTIYYYVVYLYKTFWPQNLTVWYPFVKDLPWWKIGGASVLLMGSTIAAIITAKRHPYFLCGWLWYLGTLVPVMGLVRIADFAMADRYTYVPLIGIFIIMAWGVPDLLNSLRYRNYMFGFGATLVVAMCGVATWFQIQVWRSDYTLFKQAVSVTSGNYLAHNNLGIALKKRGKLNEAIDQFKESLRINPRYAKPCFNIGNTLTMQGKLGEGQQYFQMTIQIDPDFAEAHINLGNILTGQGEIAEAIRHYKEALRINPELAEVYDNLGNAYRLQGRLSEAIENYKQALLIKPGIAGSYYNLGKVLQEDGRLSEAVAQYNAALKINQEFPEAHYNLGNVYRMMGEHDAAITQYKAALQIQPGFIEASYNLAALYAITQSFDNALSWFEKTLALAPDNPHIYYDIACVYALQKQESQSVEWLRKAIEKGFQNWNLIKADARLEFIRGSPEYKALIGNR